MASRRHPRRVDKDDADVDIKAKPYGCHLSRPYLLFTEFLYVGTGFPWLGLPFTSVSPIRLNIPSFTEFYRVLPSFTEFYRVLLGCTEFFRVSPSISGFLPSFTGLYWV